MTPAIEIKNVAKAFGDNQPVKDLSFTIPRGALYGFIGSNGAGKTTTLRMILSILFQDSGEIAVLSNQSALDAKDRIGLGQMGVGFIVLALYAGLGGVGLATFAALGFIDALLVVFLVLFYLVF